jgi:hypothetical protein
MHLLRMDEDGVVSHRYAGGLCWERLGSSERVAA